MNVLDARIESFRPCRVPKNPSTSSSATVLVKWPHPPTYKATPATLADAGFIYAPTLRYKDTVVCFSCGKELNDWGEDDDPAEVHFDKCGDTCSWASVKCGFVRDIDNRKQFIATDPSRLPSGKVLEKCRLDTFSSWPHDAFKGHGASSKKMAKAGFLYTPQGEGDDSASCVYCDIVLNGWEPDDDPIEEHRKRDKKAGTVCAFFSAKSSPLNRSTSKPQSKSTSRSTTRSRSIKQKPIASETDQSSGEEINTLRMSTRSSRSTKSRADIMKAPAATKSRRATGASKRKTVTTGSEAEEQSGSGAGQLQKSTIRRAKSRGKIDSIAEEAETVAAFEEIEEPVRKLKRGKGKAKEAFADEVETAPEEPRKPPARSRCQTKSRTRLRVDSGCSDVPIQKESNTQTAISDSESELSGSQDTARVKPAPSKSRVRRPPTQTSSKNKDISTPPLDEGSRTPKKVSKSHLKVKHRLPESESEDIWQSAVEEHEEQFARAHKEVKRKPSARFQSSKKTADKPSSLLSDEEQRHKTSRKSSSKGAPFHDKSSNRVHIDPSKRMESRMTSRTSIGSKENALRPSEEQDSESLAHRAIIDISDDAEDMTITKSAPNMATSTPFAVGGSEAKPAATQKFEIVIERLVEERSQVTDVHERVEVPMQLDADTSRNPTHSNIDLPSGEVYSPKPSAARLFSQEKPGPAQDTDFPESPMAVDKQDLFAEHEVHNRMLLSTPTRAEDSNPFSQLPTRDSDDPLSAFQVPYGKVPTEILFKLTEDEKDMTIEEWTRKELETQLENFRQDGYRRIQEFKDRAAEVRRQIEAL